MERMNLFYLISIMLLSVLLVFSCSMNPSQTAEADNTESGTDLDELESMINQEISVLESRSTAGRAPTVNVTSEESLLILQEAYYYFLTGMVPEFVNMFSDDVQLIHQGVENPLLPFYGVYNGKQEFMIWLYNLGSSATFNGVTMNYLFAENNRVESSVLEDVYMHTAQNTVRIENQHSFVLNEDKKICRMLVISESETVYNSLNGTPGEIYETENKVPVQNASTVYNAKYYKIMSLFAVLYMHRNKFRKLERLVSDDVEIIFPGDEDIVPYAGKYTGKDELKSFVKAFSKERIMLLPEAVISGFNKAHYQYNIIGCVKKTGNTIDNIGCLSFQFDDNGKISKIYNFYDTEAVKRAYSN